MVENSNDAGAGSLRQAVIDAIEGDTILFSADTSGDTIFLNAQILLDKNLVITGNDSSLTILDANGVDRIFDIPSSDTIEMWSVTMRNGGDVVDDGGAISNRGYLSLYACQIVDNHIIGTIPRNGAGIYNQGTLRSYDCAYRNNVINHLGTSGGGLEEEQRYTVKVMVS